LRAGSIALNCMAPTPTTLFGFDYQLVTFPGQESSNANHNIKLHGHPSD